jgi:hypothetical protein
MADIDFNALGQAMDTTWGRSSTPKASTHSVKFRLLGTDRLEASYAGIVKFITEKQMIEMKRTYAGESDDVINAVLKHIKTAYKDLSGLTLKTSELPGGSVDTLEIINLNVHNPLRTAYYRRKVVFELG